jgi:hypothetical protein
MTLKKGINSLGYVGVTAKSPPGKVILKRDPVVGDWRGHSHGTIWLNSLTKEVFILTDIVGSSGTMHGSGSGSWLKLQSSGGAAGDLIGIVTDDANTTTNDANGDIRLSGGTNIETYEIGPSTIGIKMPANIVTGGTINPTILNAGALNTGILTDLSLAGGGLVKASVLGTLGLTPDGVDGEILIGSTTGDTTWGNVTSGDPNVIVTNSANNIEIKTTRGADGQLLIHGGGLPAWANITAGDGIIILNAANTCIIEKTAGNRSLPPCTMLETDDPPPAGGTWLPCNGAVISQADYPDLFNCLGHKYAVSGLTYYYNPSPRLQVSLYSFAKHNGLTGNDELWMTGGNTYNQPHGWGSSLNLTAISRNGIDWEYKSIIDSTTGRTIMLECNELPYPDNRWVMVTSIWTGPYNVITKYWYSDNDGTTWTKSFQSSGNPHSGYDESASDFHYGIVHNKLSGLAGLWILNNKANVRPTSYKYKTSTDGITWTERSLPNTSISSKFFSFKDGVWVCAAEYYYTCTGCSTYGTKAFYFYYSSDAINWTLSMQIDLNLSRCSHTDSPHLLKITIVEDKFMVAFKTGRSDYPSCVTTKLEATMYSSTDGQTWKKEPKYAQGAYLGVNQHLTDFAYNDGLFFLKVYNEYEVRNSTDYESQKWDNTNIIYRPQYLGNIYSMASNKLTAGNSRWVLTCGTGILYGSPEYNETTHFQLPNRPGWMILS